MKYPKYNHYLIFNRISKDDYHVKNLMTEEEWEMSEAYVRFLRSLDGKTDPYSIDRMDEKIVSMLLEEAEEEGLLDLDMKFIPMGFGSILIPFWFPKVRTVHRILGAIWNRLLMLTWLPLFIAGLYILLNSNWKVVESGFGLLKGYLIGIGMGMLLHEISHAAACIGYSMKNSFLEMGIMTRLFWPGAYVVIDYSEMKNRFKRAQINAAGVESNIGLCGVFLCCLSFGIFDSYTLLAAAMINFLLAVLNTTLIDGLDGMGIFKEVFAGSDDFFERAMALVRNRCKKKQLRKCGINGNVTIAACYIIVIMQVLVPVIFLVNLMYLVGMIL